MKKLHGFTLVEMAVVLVIIGLIMAAALGVGNAQMQSARISATKQKQEAIRLALINFISRNNRLPCPAKADLLPGDVNYGVEAATPGICTGTGVPPVVSGIVPFVSLGITDENASDGYYNRFTYLIALSATADTQNIAGLKGLITIHKSAPPLPGLQPGGNQTNVCFVGNYNPCLAVVAIISHGVNGRGAYTAGGTLIPGAVGDEAENANGDKAVVMKEFASNTADPFDDILLPLTASEMLSSLTNNGSLKDFRAQLNDSFKNMTAAVIADAVGHRSLGATPNRTYPLPPATPIIVDDPWGQPIRYTPTPGVSPISLLLSNAGDIAFTLRSAGPDATFDNADDIIKEVFVAEPMDTFNGTEW